MTEDETQAVLTYARNLWPQWKPDEADIDAWRRLLSRIHAPKIACEALQELNTTTDWRGPKRAQVLTLLGQMTGTKTTSGIHEGQTGLYVQCVSHPTKPSVLGHWETLHYRTDRDLPDENTIRRHLEQHRQALETHHGGDWQIITAGLYGEELTNQDMQQRKYELRDMVPVNHDSEPF